MKSEKSIRAIEARMERVQDDINKQLDDRIDELIRELECFKRYPDREAKAYQLIEWMPHNLTSMMSAARRLATNCDQLASIRYIMDEEEDV